MKTNDLIKLLQRQDPTGEAEIVLFGKSSGYIEVNGAWKTELILDSGNPNGEHLCVEEYKYKYPRGRKKPVPALVIVQHP